MSIIREIKNEYLIYENQELAELVAIHKDNQKIIKAYWKNKNKKENEIIEGHPMIVDEEHQSLKIDFSKTVEYQIKDLSLFK